MPNGPTFVTLELPTALQRKGIPLAFQDEPFRTLVRGPSLLQHEVLSVLSISIAEFTALRLEGYLRPISSSCGTLYHRKKVVAFAYGLTVSVHLAETVAFIVGRREENWARPGPAAPRVTAAQVFATNKTLPVR